VWAFINPHCTKFRTFGLLSPNHAEQQQSNLIDDHSAFNILSQGYQKAESQQPLTSFTDWWSKGEPAWGKANEVPDSQGM